MESLIETLLKGVMMNDEVMAPLDFLLQEKYVTSDRARVAIYAVSHSIPHMPSNALALTAKSLINLAGFKVILK